MQLERSGYFPDAASAYATCASGQQANEQNGSKLARKVKAVALCIIGVIALGVSLAFLPVCPVGASLGVLAGLTTIAISAGFGS